MARHLHRDVDRLQRSVVTMAGIVEEAIFAATQALQMRSAEAAQRVIDGDGEIDLLENQVQEECLRVLALHAPVASDLRHITTILLISTDLERMGDLAAGIAERAIDLARPGALVPPRRIVHMAESVIRMVRQALDAYIRCDAEAARSVILKDDEVDADNRAIINAVLEQMKRSTDCVEYGISLFSAVRYLERIADHATNIAEDVIFMVDGQMVRHHPEVLLARKN